MGNSILTKEAVNGLAKKFIELETKFENACFSDVEMAAFEEIKHDLIDHLGNLKKEPDTEQQSTVVYLQKILSFYIVEG